MQEKKVAELLQDVTGDLILAKPANPARFIHDWMSRLVGYGEAEGETEEGSGTCFFRVHVECGVEGKRVREHFSRRSPKKGFKAEVMRGWRREASVRKGR